MKTLILLAGLQTVATAPTPQAAPPPHVDRPFRVGEQLNYAVKMGILRLGSGQMEVAAVDTLRGVESYHFVFTLEGGIPGYRIDDRLESWTGTEDMISRRFYKEIKEGGRERFQTFEIFPDSGHYRLVGSDQVEATPARPLDDTAFFYFVRTTPLEVGKTYRFNRYYRDDRNPLTIQVKKRETMELPDGSKVPCLVVHPEIDEEGLIGRRAKAEVWLTDDARRIPVQIRSKLPFGTITLRLESMNLGDPSAP